MLYAKAVSEVVGDELLNFLGVAKGSSISWVAKFKGDKNSECNVSNGWSRRYRLMKRHLSAEK